ncbi:MAG: M23 family metallopeptidase [Candidatus Fimivivens sp.]
MQLKYLLSAAALFFLLSYIGVWLSMMMLNKHRPAETISKPPMSVSVSSDSPDASGLTVSGDMPDPVSSEPPKNDLSAKSGFELSDTNVYPGEYLVLTAYGIDDPGKITVQNPFGKSPTFFKTDDHLTALLPVKYTYAPGEYMLTAEGNGFNEVFAINLLPKEWQTQNLTVDESVTSETIENTAANDEYFAKVQPKKALFEPAPLWEGPFIQPVEGEITTEFGMLRTINGVPSDRHGGTDIATARGTPVKAANSGKVLFADKIALTGNTVCIEHGMGLKTWYYHMDSLDVKVDDIVKKGQQIGTVGDTGFATGPHLHWAASVFDVYINPWSLITAAPQL